MIKDNSNIISNKKHIFKLNGLLYSLFALIYFQQAFVINIGGSLKTYELIGLFIVLYFLLKGQILVTKEIMILFFFFVISPILSFVFLFITPDRFLYYNRFPVALNQLRANELFTVFYSFLLCLINFAIASLVITSKFVYLNRCKIIKLFVYTGTVISLYSLYAFIFVGYLKLPDIVPAFLDARNTLPSFTHRTTGFSDEPGIYVIIQTIVVYYIFFDKSIFIKRYYAVLAIINILSLVLTISSSLVITIVGLFFYVIFISKNKLKYLYILMAFTILAIVGIQIDIYTNGYLQYTYINKIHFFFTKPTNTLDSGAMRAFTSSLGLKVFEDFPVFGCGVGFSNHFMWLHEYKIGIDIWGERIGSLTYPQNGHVKILAEQGVFGYSFFLLFFIYSFVLFWRKRFDAIIGVHLVILITLFIFHFISYPATNLFMWLNIYLGLNYIYQSKRNASHSMGKY